MKTSRRTFVALTLLATSCAVAPVLVASQVGAQGASSRGNRAVEECQGRNLVGFSLGGGAGLGNLANNVGIINMGATSCRLGGYPGLEGTRSGHVYLLSGPIHGTYFGDLDPTVLAPRMAGAVIIATDDACNALSQPNRRAVKAEMAAHTYTGVVIELPQHGGSVVVNGVRIDTACGLWSSRLGWRNSFLGGR